MLLCWRYFDIVNFVRMTESQLFAVNLLREDLKQKSNIFSVNQIHKFAIESIEILARISGGPL